MRVGTEIGCETKSHDYRNVGHPIASLESDSIGVSMIVIIPNLHVILYGFGFYSNYINQTIFYVKYIKCGLYSSIAYRSVS